MFYRLALAWLLLVAPCAAATHTVTWTAATGGTYYAYPAGSSLGDWATNRVQLAESGAPNEGYYSGTVDDTDGVTWYLFSGATQPSAWNEAIGVQTVLVAADAIAISGDETAANNLEAASDGAGYNLGGGSIVAASVTGAVGEVTGDVNGAIQGDLLGDVAGSINATGLGQVADAVWDEPQAGHAGVGTFGEAAIDASSDAATAASQTSAASIRTAVGLAAANLDTQFGDLPTAAENADAVWDELQSGHTTAGTFGNYAGSLPDILADTNELQTDDVPGLIAALTIPSAGTIADAVWDEAQSGHVTAGTFGLYLDSAISGVSTGGVSAADIADAVWDEARAGHTTGGTFGEGVASVQGNVDGSVASVTGAVGSVTGNVGGNVTGSVGSLADNGASITAMPWPAAWDAEIQSEVADGLTAYDAATGTDVSSAGVAADRGLRAPLDSMTFRVSRRSDGTYTTDRPLRLRPGTTESVRVGLDMGRLAPNQYVATVGTPAVSGGSLTATDPERYDAMATFVVGGTATASESRTIDVTVTMERGDVFVVTLPVEVFAD